MQVVCGAPNARAGLVGVFGVPGATCPANGMVLKVAAIRGVESNGMMCSTRELELGDDHDGIIELPADAPVGATLSRLCRAERSGVRRQRSRRTGRIAWACAASRAIWRRRGWGRSSRSPRSIASTRLRRSRAKAPAPTCAPTIPRAAPPSTRRPCRGVTNGAAPEWMRARLKRDRAEADLGAGRHHQLRHGRSRPPAARLRPRQADRRARRAQGARPASRCWRSTARPIRSTRR